MWTQVGMNGDTFSIKAPKECSKKFAATFKGKFLTGGNVLRIFFLLLEDFGAASMEKVSPLKLLWVDNESQHKILELHNEIHYTKTIPDHVIETQVVELYKSGKTPELYSSYRPAIALLNINFKMVAKLI